MIEPSRKQARILWFSLTALAIAVVIALVACAIWGLGWVINLLSPVLVPLGIAGILAYLLDPVVDFFSRKMSRTKAIVLVFALVTLIFAGLLATVVPRLVVETRELIQKIPDYSQRLQEKANDWISNSTLAHRFDLPFLRDKTGDSAAAEEQAAPEKTKPSGETANLGGKLLAWAADVLPAIGLWILAQLQRIASWFGVLIGLALVPVYLFYFLREKSGITTSWTDYLPLQESKAKEEIIFVIKSINDSLIVFFRGQVLVAICDGILLVIGFLFIGLEYAFLLGAVAGLLSMIPYLGVLLSLVPAVILAIVQFGDWLHPLLVVGLFALVNMLEGFVISPKIIGDRVGLHPLTIIIAVMVGTTLMGGILGGVLAIPLTAALRAIMFRYVWKNPRG